MAISRHKFRQLLTFCPAFLTAFMGGTNVGWLAPVLNRSQDAQYDISLSSSQRSWIASLQEPFKICGLLVGALLVDLYGRKRLLLGCLVLNFLGWMLIALTSSTNILYISRFFFGLAAGIEDTVLPICVGENSFPELRGVIVSINCLCFFGAMVFQFTLATYLSYTTVAAVNAVFGFAQLVSYFLMRETAQFLIMRGKYKEAEQNYRWLFSEEAAEFEQLKCHVKANHKSSSSWTKLMLTNPAYYKSISIVLFLTVLTFGTGIWTLMPYISITLGSSALLTANEFSIVFGVIQFCTVLANSFFIERVPRRIILLVASTAAAVAHASSAILFYLHEHKLAVPHFSWLIFVTITLYMTITSSTIMPITIVQRGELFPLKIKAAGNAFVSSIASMVVFSMSMSYLNVANRFGFSVNFMFFTMVSVIMFAFVYLFVPETKGKSLAEIQASLEKQKS